MKKSMGLIVLVMIIFYNYEKINEVLFEINLSKNQLNYNETYSFDLNGDRNNEKIKLKSYKDEQNNFIVDLYINNRLEEKYKYEDNISVYIYDFNKVDRYKEIYVASGNKIENSKMNIFIYNDEGKSNNFTMDGRAINNDDKNGTIKITYASTKNSSNFDYYSKVVGGEPIAIDYIYKRVLYCDLIDVEKKEVKVVGSSKEKEYTVNDEIIVYETNMGDVKAYTLSKGDKIKLISLYDNNDNHCIKLVNREGRYGWVKVEDKQLFQVINIKG